jgi:hypothetical protein
MIEVLPHINGGIHVFDFFDNLSPNGYIIAFLENMNAAA